MGVWVFYNTKKRKILRMLLKLIKLCEPMGAPLGFVSLRQPFSTFFNLFQPFQPLSTPQSTTSHPRVGSCAASSNTCTRARPWPSSHTCPPTSQRTASSFRCGGARTGSTLQLQARLRVLQPHSLLLCDGFSYKSRKILEMLLKLERCAN